MNSKIKYIAAFVVLVAIAIIVIWIINHNSAPSATIANQNPNLDFIDTPSAFFSNFSYVNLELGNPNNNSRTSYFRYSISSVTINSTAFFVVNFTSPIALAPNGSPVQYNITYRILLNQKNASIYNITYNRPNGTSMLLTGQNAVISVSFYLYPLESLVLSGSYALNQPSTINSRGALANQTLGNTRMNVTPFNLTEQYFTKFVISNSTPVTSKVAPYNATIQVGALPGKRYLVVSRIINSTGYWITSLTQR